MIAREKLGCGEGRVGGVGVGKNRVTINCHWGRPGGWGEASRNYPLLSHPSLPMVINHSRAPLFALPPHTDWSKAKPAIDAPAIYPSLFRERMERMERGRWGSGGSKEREKQKRGESGDGGRDE